MTTPKIIIATTIFFMSVITILTATVYLRNITAPNKPSPRDLPLLAVDSAPSDWNTYQDAERGWHLKYPSDWTVTNNDAIKIIGRRINWYYFTQDQIPNCQGLCFNPSSRRSISFNNFAADKISGQLAGRDITLPQSYVCYQISTPLKDYLHICLWELPLDLGESQEATLQNRTPQPIVPADEIIMDQIVNSIQF